VIGVEEALIYVNVSFKKVRDATDDEAPQ